MKRTRGCHLLVLGGGGALLALLMKQKQEEVGEAAYSHVSLEQ